MGEATAGGWDIETILFSPDRLSSGFALNLLARHPARLEQVSLEVLESIAEKENPTGIVAVVHQRHVKFDALPALHRAAALVAPQDPGNLGTVLRTLDAVGGEALCVLDGGVDPYHPTAIRAAMGASFWIPVVEGTFAEFDAWRRARGYQAIGSSARAARDFRDFQPPGPWILVLGKEQTGLTDYQKGACDVLISLPMLGRASSLNVAVAAGVLLYQLAGLPPSSQTKRSD